MHLLLDMLIYVSISSAVALFLSFKNKCSPVLLCLVSFYLYATLSYLLPSSHLCFSSFLCLVSSALFGFLLLSFDMCLFSLVRPIGSFLVPCVFFHVFFYFSLAIYRYYSSSSFSFLIIYPSLSFILIQCLCFILCSPTSVVCTCLEAPLRSSSLRSGAS